MFSKSCFKVLVTTFTLALFLAIAGCGTTDKGAGKKADVKGKKTARQSLETTLESAQNMLRMDDYRDFEKAEFQFIAVRIWKMEDVKVAGWLAQLYVAWTDQLKYEISFLRLKLEAGRSFKPKEDIQALETIIDYRIEKLTEVEENAQQLCNMLKTYYPDSYLSHRVMADYYRIMGDEEKFRNRLLIVKELNPDSNGLLFLEGAASDIYDNDHIAAIDYYEKALKNDPKFVKALYFKGLAYHKMGHERRAKETMNEVLAISKNHPGAKAFLSATEYINELTEEAKRALKGTKIKKILNKDKPQLIYWVADWPEGKGPELKYRIAAPTEFDADVQLNISLVENTDKAIQTLTLLEKMKAGEFRTLSQHFYPPQKRKGFTYEIIIQLSVKLSGEDKFKVIQIRKATVPIRQ